MTGLVWICDSITGGVFASYGAQNVELADRNHLKIGLQVEFESKAVYCDPSKIVSTFIVTCLIRRKRRTGDNRSGHRAYM